MFSIIFVIYSLLIAFWLLQLCINVLEFKWKKQNHFSIDNVYTNSKLGIVQYYYNHTLDMYSYVFTPHIQNSHLLQYSKYCSNKIEFNCCVIKGNAKATMTYGSNR